MPDKLTERLEVRCSRKEKSGITKLALRKDRTRSDLLRQALQEMLRKEGVWK